MSSSKVATPWLSETASNFVKAAGDRPHCLCGSEARPERKMVVVHRAKMSLNICKKCGGVVR